MWLIVQAARGKLPNEGRVSETVCCFFRFLSWLQSVRTTDKALAHLTKWEWKTVGEKRGRWWICCTPIHRCATAKTKIPTCMRATLPGWETLHSNGCRQLLFGPEIQCLGRASSCSPLSFSSFKMLPQADTRAEPSYSTLSTSGRAQRRTKLPC